MEHRNRNLKVIVRRDPDAPHLWIAQLLDGDLVGQGKSLEAALEDLRGAVVTFLAFALAEADDAFDSCSAPDEAQRLFELVEKTGSPTVLTPEFYAEADEEVGALAVRLNVLYVTESERRAAVLPNVFRQMPLHQACP